MKKLVLLIAIAITSLSFDSYSQSSYSKSSVIEELMGIKSERTLKLEQQAENRRKRDEQLEDLFSRPIDMSSPLNMSYDYDKAREEWKKQLSDDSYNKPKKKKPFQGMTIEQLSQLHAEPSTGFGSIPESVTGSELLKSNNNGNKYFKRPK